MSDPKQRDSVEFFSTAEIELVDRLARRIVDMRMTAPAILFLESIGPLNFVGSQVMVFFAPVVRAVFDFPAWDQLSRIFERRESVGYVLDRIEALESERMERERRERIERRREKVSGNRRVPLYARIFHKRRGGKEIPEK